MADDQNGGVATPTQEKWKFPILVFFKDVRIALKLDRIGREIHSIAIPAAMALAADPIASLIDTVFIGRIGPVEIAAVGVSIALFNQVSKVAIFPLVSITTSFVAEEETIERMNSKAIEVDNMKNDYDNKERKQETTLDDVQLKNLENGSTEKDEQKESSLVDGMPLKRTKDPSSSQYFVGSVKRPKPDLNRRHKAIKALF